MIGFLLAALRGQLSAIAAEMVISRYNARMENLYGFAGDGLAHAADSDGTSICGVDLVGEALEAHQVARLSHRASAGCCYPCLQWHGSLGSLLDRM